MCDYFHLNNTEFRIPKITPKSVVTFKIADLITEQLLISLVYFSNLRIDLC